MIRWLIGYVATLITLGCLDAVYLGLVGGRLFKSTLGDVVAPNFQVLPIVLFYALYPAGLVIFAESAGGAANRWSMAALLGALFGFFAYATYDLTNWATIRNWTPTLVAIDLIWGTVLSSASALAGALALRWMEGGR